MQRAGWINCPSDATAARYRFATLGTEEFMRRLRTTLLIAILSFTSCAYAQERSEANSAVIWIGLQHGSERESLMASELRALIRRYDVMPWVLTQRILIDQNQLPHSHPILTIHTRHIGDEFGLLATFVHEQLHWLEEEPWIDRFRAAMEDFKTLFPDVPLSTEGGARDEMSTYRHLLVCDLEYQAMGALVGEAVARETLRKFSHYGWIYEQVLTDTRVREVAIRHGFDVSDGVPDPR
jgi:hypothetical protein